MLPSPFSPDYASACLHRRNSNGKKNVPRSWSRPKSQPNDKDQLGKMRG
ncbi:hypothetical protein LEMLEM_LOCUS16434, partial [Lemmus lemmus]